MCSNTNVANLWNHHGQAGSLVRPDSSYSCWGSSGGVWVCERCARTAIPRDSTGTVLNTTSLLADSCLSLSYLISYQMSVAEQGAWASHYNWPPATAAKCSTAMKHTQGRILMSFDPKRTKLAPRPAPIPTPYPPPPPPPPFPNAAPLAPGYMLQQPQVMHGEFAVKVPPGVGPGTVLQVVAPASGQVLNVTVPAALNSDGTFLCRY